jgi:hypothetical protein
MGVWQMQGVGAVERETEIRIPKFEIQNKSEIQRPKTHPASHHGNWRVENTLPETRSSVPAGEMEESSWICRRSGPFGFRPSDFRNQAINRRSRP